MNLNGYSTPPKPTISSFNPSFYQQAALGWAQDNAGKKKAAVMIAVAGSGKSRTLRYIYEETAHNFNRILLVCFGKDNAVDAREKNKENKNIQNVSIVTYHSYGFSGIRKIASPRLDETKVETIIKPKLADNLRLLIGPIKKLTSLCKANAFVEPDDALLDDISYEFDIDFGDETSRDLVEKCFSLTRYALKESLERFEQVIDFDDMIYVPVVLRLKPDQYDCILADEFQDTNQAQAALIQLGRTDMMVGVGDPWQSIYAFRGADSKAMQRLTDNFNADNLPLTISYRCPLAVGDLVRQEFPHIGFQSPEWAIEGKIDSIDTTKSLQLMQDGDLVVSRINAALPPIAFGLIRMGKPAHIMGREIGKNLIHLIQKMDAVDIPDLNRKLRNFRETQIRKFEAAHRMDKIADLQDKIETIDALSEGANTVWDIVTRCNTLFSDDRVGIQLGTIHKNKGREAKNVYIARPDLLPLPFVMSKGSAEDKQQEMNMRYVAITRSQDNLTFLTGDMR